MKNKTQELIKYLQDEAIVEKLPEFPTMNNGQWVYYVEEGLGRGRIFYDRDNFWARVLALEYCVERKLNEAMTDSSRTISLYLIHSNWQNRVEYYKVILWQDMNFIKEGVDIEAKLFQALGEEVDEETLLFSPEEYFKWKALLGK